MTNFKGWVGSAWHNVTGRLTNREVETGDAAARSNDPPMTNREVEAGDAAARSEAHLGSLNQKGTTDEVQEEGRFLEALRQAQTHMAIPVVWLLGKTQSGKTSIVRALTGSTRAEIGNGFQPCTRTASIYHFPDETTPLIRFLDTRGLGEIHYDPTDDLRQFQDQAHLLMIVVKAMDPNQRAVLEAARMIRRARPNWPILVVQTNLHEGYPHGMNHPPQEVFDQVPWPSEIPSDLARSLTAQRAEFAELGPDLTYVAVDLTREEDGFTPVDYRLPALWKAIEESLPMGLRTILEQDAHERLDDRRRRAHPRIIAHAAAAAAAAAMPIPYLGTPALLSIQTRLAYDLARLYNRPMTPARLGELAAALGVGFLGRLGARELLKVIPGLGSAVSATMAATVTFALGYTLCAYFEALERGDLPNSQLFRELYRRELERGKVKMADYLKSSRRC